MTVKFSSHLPDRFCGSNMLSGTLAPGFGSLTMLRHLYLSEYPALGSPEYSELFVQATIAYQGHLSRRFVHGVGWFFFPLLEIWS